MFENLELALETDHGVRPRCSSASAARSGDRIGEVLALIHLSGKRAAPPAGPQHGQKQWLEIGMLLMQDPRLLLLDEPVAGMTDEETERTAELFLSPKGRHSLVVVEHDMGFIAALISRADKKVTVLHEGNVLAARHVAWTGAGDEGRGSIREANACHGQPVSEPVLRRLATSCATLGFGRRPAK